MALDEYTRKRDFARTPEPAPQGRESPGGGRFVVQKHAASRLHYDLRLEMDGVLKSWAVPKGPSRRPGDRQLAVHTEDHPVQYIDFEGVIPQGQYGGGTMIVWDTGTWKPVGNARKDYEKGRMKLELFGEKLHGRWALVRMGGKAGEDGRNWLLIKDRDDHATDENEPRLVDTMPLSVKTGRSIEQVAEEDGNRPEDRKPTRVKLREREPMPRRTWPRQAKQADMPETIQPQLATLVEQAPSGGDWIHEIKYDGYRLLIRLDDGEVHLWTRGGKDWTSKFSRIAEAAAGLKATQAWIDGELVVLERDGTSSFAALQQAISLGEQDRMLYFAFDLLYLDGRDLRDAPQLERKRLLMHLIEDDATSAIRFSDHLAGQGRTLHRQACEHDLEGIVSKAGDAPYIAGRSRYWAKVKCSKRQEFVIVGYTDPGGSRIGFGALHMAYRDADQQWVYAGKVGTGFNDRTLTDLRKRMEKLERDEPLDLDNPPTGKEAREAHWIQPKLLAEVQFTGWTDDNLIRHGSFQGLREDKPAQEVHKEEPVQTTATRKKGSPTEVAGVRLSSPDKVLYPEQGATKLDLAQYYEKVADWMLPHVADRPLAIVRCPQGVNTKCFFQKHTGEGMPESIGGVEVQFKSGTSEHMCIKDAAGLVSLVQMGVLEIHPWNSRTDKVDRPDRLIFDLDPGEGVSWEQVIDAAREVRDLLAEVDLVTFVKNTGSKGLHVVVPLERRRDFDEAKAFAQAVTQTLGRRDRKRYVTVMTKSKRSGKIYLDYLRNGYGATAIAPYSTRRRTGAPVSTPLTWDELSPDVGPDHYTIENTPERLAKLKDDPWAGYFDVRQSITKAAEKHFGV